MRLASIAAMAAISAALASPAFAADEHKVLAPQEIKWSPGPASLPKGAEVAVLSGDPAKEGPFTMRLKFPKGFQIAPHNHPKPEVVTVISGAFRIGMGDTAEPAKAKALPPGGFFAFPAGMNHFAMADEETVVQLNSVGPWGVKYVNEKDDPRQKTQ